MRKWFTNVFRSDKSYQEKALSYLDRIEKKVDSIIDIKFAGSEYKDMSKMSFSVEGGEILGGVYCKKIPVSEY